MNDSDLADSAKIWEGKPKPHIACKTKGKSIGNCFLEARGVKHYKVAEIPQS